MGEILKYKYLYYDCEENNFVLISSGYLDHLIWLENAYGIYSMAKKDWCSLLKRWERETVYIGRWD